MCFDHYENHQIIAFLVMKQEEWRNAKNRWGYLSKLDEFEMILEEAKFLGIALDDIPEIGCTGSY